VAAFLSLSQGAGLKPIAAQHPGGVLLPPVQTLVATLIFACGENVNRVLPPQPTLRTEKDIGSENPETTTVSGFFRAFF